jgi:hypothetical protein
MSKPSCLLLLLVLVALAQPARAQVDAWEFEVYPAQTVGKGMLELEGLNSFVAKGPDSGYSGTASGDIPSDQMYRGSLEVTYGLLDNVEAAAYVNIAKPEDEGIRYAGAKFRFRGSLFEQGELPVDLGWYVEFEWNKTPQFDDEKVEFELKPIVSRDLGPFTVSLNPKFEKVLDGPGSSDGFEFGYAAGISYRWKRWLSPGVEFYGGIGLVDDIDPTKEQQHYVFPVVHGELPGGIEYSLGPGFGLTPGSDRVIAKVNIELERFIGSLF